ncbi:hypothetical protein HPT27_10435 [Permianibacter sp. IMCC34836]|uniref:hypothetical protein n=1 Tax=Permianibacter fluminis TaxID=2738515 RepID=UPI00155456AF|nr:hypothetical protein [Permianibacter fluminis]NQD37446.1 hypothetical protein [Permianibacter fluminis]
MPLIRDPRQQPRHGDRLIRHGKCRLVVRIETGFNGGITAVHWVNGSQYRDVYHVPKHAIDGAYNVSIAAWRSWANDGAKIISEVSAA